MDQEIQDALNVACPKTTMSPAEIVNAYIDQCCGNSFAEAEKFFRKMGDNSGIASVDHYEKFRLPISPAVYYGGVTFNIKKHE